MQCNVNPRRKVTNSGKGWNVKDRLALPFVKSSEQKGQLSELGQGKMCPGGVKCTCEVVRCAVASVDVGDRADGQDCMRGVVCRLKSRALSWTQEEDIESCQVEK